MEVYVLKLKMVKLGVCASWVITDVYVKKDIVHHGPEWIIKSIDECETMTPFISNVS